MVIKYHKQDIPVLGSDDKNKKLVNTVKRWKEDCEAWVGTWETNQVKWHKLRMRIKKTKTFPFAGCSNIRMPTLDTKIRKLKAALLNVLFGIRPIIQVTPNPSGNWETAKKIEKFLDYLLLDVMKVKKKLVIAVDQALEKGFFLLKPFWRREIITRVEKFSLDELSLEEVMWVFDPNRQPEEIEKAVIDRVSVDLSSWVKLENLQEVQRIIKEVLEGKSEVSFEIKDVIYNAPDVALCAPERVYVPTTTGHDPQSASYIIHEFYLPYRTVKANAETKGWNKEEVDKLEVKKNIKLDDKTIDVKKDEREGIQRLQSTNELVKIQECYTWYDINSDGVDEKCIVTIAPEFNLLLRKVSLPYFSGKFPFVKFFFELLDDRWFSHRGLPELVEDIVKEIDIQHMQKIDYGTVTNSPMFAFRAGQVNTNTMQFLFGQGIPVHGMQDLDDTIKPLNLHNPNVEFSYEKEQMVLETKIEELLGQVDFTLQSMINKRQPRTLGEVQLQQQNAQQVFSLDADIFRESFTELVNWVWELFCQYGDDEVTFGYFGQEGYEKITMNREEAQNKYTFTVRGNDQNTNPAVRQQKASFVLQDTYQAFQMGLVSPQSVQAARKRAYQVIDVDGYEEFLQPPPPPPPPDDIKVKADDLTDAEKAQVLKKRGINPDVEGRRLNEENRRDEEEFKQLVEAANATGGE